MRQFLSAPRPMQQMSYKVNLNSCQESSTANILFKPVGTGFSDQVDNITSSIETDSIEDKLLS